MRLISGTRSSHSEFRETWPCGVSYRSMDGSGIQILVNASLIIRPELQLSKWIDLRFLRHKKYESNNLGICPGANSYYVFWSEHRHLGAVHIHTYHPRYVVYRVDLAHLTSDGYHDIGEFSRWVVLKCATGDSTRLFDI